jgi:hypothetical protein
MSVVARGMLREGRRERILLPDGEIVVRRTVSVSAAFFKIIKI